MKIPLIDCSLYNYTSLHFIYWAFNVNGGINNWLVVNKPYQTNKHYLNVPDFSSTTIIQFCLMLLSLQRVYSLSYNNFLVFFSFFHTYRFIHALIFMCCIRLLVFKFKNKSKITKITCKEIKR